MKGKGASFYNVIREGLSEDVILSIEPNEVRYKPHKV